jgi:SAM-dependent methyltransferase
MRMYPVQNTGRPPNLKKFETCPICKGAIILKYHNLKDRFGISKEYFQLFECTGCQLAFLNPMPTGDLSEMYPFNYLSSEKKEQLTAVKKFDIEKWYRNDQYTFDFRLFTKSTGLKINMFNSFIDIGCGSGERVNFVYENGCKKAWGIDKMDFKKKNLNPCINFINAEILEFSPAEKFHVAAIAHVLEHLENPIEILKHIKKNILVKNGYLFIQVPNYHSFERKLFKSKWFCLDAPRHLWHFNKTVLQKILTDLDYKIEGGYTVNAPLHPVSVVPSLFRKLDIQRIWIDSKHSDRYKKVQKMLWAGFTILSIPFNLYQNLLRSSSMLTIIARN